MLLPSVRRHSLGVVISLLLALGLWRTTAAYAMVKPNIVLIMTDDAGYNDYGFSSALFNVPTNAITPNINALASAGTVLKQGYISALFAPSRAAMLTGQYGQRFGFEMNLSNGPEGLPAGKATIATQLKSLGYTTGIFGKWHQGTALGPEQFGFDQSFIFLGGDRPMWGGGPNAAAATAMRRNGVNVETQWVTQGDTSKYDPVKGRYLTDAITEETVSFINQQADAGQPFFAYVPYNAPHTPWQAKQSDLDQFASMPELSRRTIAAMTHAVDRGVGDIISALDAKGIRDNTIFVFTNDNGGPFYLDGSSQQIQTNTPFRGHKGSLFEGGTRVPFIIDAPGVPAGVYDQPVTTVDLLPTFVAAAGGNLGAIDTNGVNLLPFLGGNQPAHDLLFWRHDRRFAVRQGDFKLMMPSYAPTYNLYNIATNPAESINLAASNPAKVAELLRELTYWEATLEKPDWTHSGVPVTRFDHFVFRNDLATSNFYGNLQWRQGGVATVTNVSFRPEDAYANGVFEFQTRNDASYTATNDAARTTTLTFMLNELRLTGAFAGAASQTGTINGNAMLFTKNLSGGGAKLRLEATASGAQRFGFFVDQELQLLDDLEITGNGTQDFTIRGAIKDYFAPRSVLKSGSSVVTLSGNNTFAGGLVVQAGEVKIAGASAAVRNAADVAIGSAAKLSLNSGLLATNRLIRLENSQFEFTGGRLNVNRVEGALDNAGGTFAPGLAFGEAHITRSYSQSASSTLEITIGGTPVSGAYDRVSFGGVANLDGLLDVVLGNGFNPVPGQLYTVASGPSILGQGLRLTSADELKFDMFLIDGPNLDQIVLRVTALIGTPVAAIGGDYNRDGRVDAADYSVWRDNQGQSGVPGLVGDGDDGSGTGTPDGIVNDADLTYWRSNFGSNVFAASADYNGNGTVGAADYTVWRDNLGSTGALGIPGDSDNGTGTGVPDGVVNIADYNYWKSRFGATSGSALASSTAVPEPTSIMVLLTIMAGAAALRRRAA